MQQIGLHLAFNILFLLLYANDHVRKSYCRKPYDIISLHKRNWLSRLLTV